MKGWRGCPANAETCALDGISTNSRIHRAELELVFARVFIGRQITGHQCRNYLLCDIKDRNGTQPFHQLLYGVRIPFGGFLRAVVHPKLFRHPVSIFLRDDRGALLEYLCRFGIRRVERLVTVHIQPLRIHPFRFLAQLEVHANIIFRDKTRVVGHSHKGLLNGHLRDKVQVNILRHIQQYPLHKERRVERDIQVSCKTKRLGIKRNKSQIDTLLVVDLKRIQQIIFIEIRA